jgi:glycerate 2-kinase
MEQSGGVLHRATVMEVLNAALRAADPHMAVSLALQSQQAKDAVVSGGNIFVVGAGKAGLAMARAAEDELGDRIAGGLVIVKEGHADAGEAPLRRIEVAEAGHPVPDERGVEATARLLGIADRAGEGDLVVCLISGGGSALLVSPAEGITLDDLQATTQLLLRSGATINELNAVRKHLSRVSGGRLALRASPARVMSLVLSDVVGSPLDVIASGPTAPDPTTYADALAVIERYGLAGQAPPTVLDVLRRGAAGQIDETPKPGDPVFDAVSNRVVAGNVTAVEAAAARAGELGLNSAVISTSVEGEARVVGVVLAGVAKEIAAHGRPARRPACILFGGETTVTVRGRGLGGRNAELALGAALTLDGLGPDLVVTSFATDGGDGASPGAGAIADGTTIARARSLGLDARAALENNDSYTFWSALGDAIVTGPTGTNVNDVMAVFAF